MSAPAVVFVKAGRFPMAYGILAGIRSAAAIGCATYADIDSRWVPYAQSRRLTGGFTLGNPQQWVETLLAAPVPSPAVLIATDDVSAVLIATHRETLRQRYLVPALEAELARTLSTKASLTRLCDDLGIPAPRTVDLSRGIPDDLRFPVVVKVDQPWQGRAVGHMSPTTVIESPSGLAEVTRGIGGVLCQEYLPAEGAQDWIVEGYVGVGGDIVFLGTARKYRSWLPGVGVACMARAEPNPVVDDLARKLLSFVGYRGLVDLDFRLDPRDGEYKLLDCNARMGAAVAAFGSEQGRDLVHIAILDLCGYKIPTQSQAHDRRLVVENLDMPARIVQRTRVPRAAGERTAFGWWDPCDPVPFMAMLPWQAGMWGAEVRRRLAR